MWVQQVSTLDLQILIVIDLAFASDMTVEDKLAVLVLLYSVTYPNMPNTTTSTLLLVVMIAIILCCRAL